MPEICEACRNRRCWDCVGPWCECSLQEYPVGGPPKKMEETQTGEHGLPECETEVATLRAALIATTKALGRRWMPDPTPAWYVDGRVRPEVADALQALGPPDPCRVEELR